MVNDYHDEVREEAAESLGKIGDQVALPFLRWTHNHDSDRSTRKDAEKAMERVRNTFQW